jgi:hypothetical protein
MVDRVPIPRQKNGQPFRLEPAYVAQENGEDFVAAADAERSAGKEIILHVRNEERIGGLERFHESCGLSCPVVGHESMPRLSTEP